MVMLVSMIIKTYIEIFIISIITVSLTSKLDIMIFSLKDMITYIMGVLTFSIVLFIPFIISKALIQKYIFLDVQNSKKPRRNTRNI